MPAGASTRQAGARATRQAGRGAVHSTQEDPIGLAGGLNLYGYADGDPINLGDPFGLCATEGGDSDTTAVAECTYSQSTGAMSCTVSRECASGTCVTERMSTRGYSGAPGFVNDATAVRLSNRGPLPPGVYDVLPGEERHRRLGNPSFVLRPQPGADLFGRGGFLVHADNRRENQSASEGCIVADQSARRWMQSRNVTELTVVK